MRAAVAGALAAVVLAIAACGGDDDGSASQSAGGQQESAENGSAGSNENGTAGSGADDGGSSAGGGSAGSEGDSGSGAKGGQGNKGGGEVPPLDLDDKAPSPKVGGKARGTAPDLSGPAKSEGDFSGLARQIYEASRFFCSQAGVEGMRREYGIESKDPEDIAREAARRNQPRGFPEAVYFGCLEGLRKPS